MRTVLIPCGSPSPPVCDATKDRLIVFGLVLAALTFVIGSVAWAHTALEAWLNLCPWAHMTLEACLNLLWILLAVGAFTHWVKLDGNGRRGHLRGVVSLIFVLALLFPVISPNDDLARLELINDSKILQSLTVSVKSDKPLSGSAGLPSSLSVLAVHIASLLPLTGELAPAPTPAASVAAPGDATGNHSPPHC